MKTAIIKREIILMGKIRYKAMMKDRSKMMNNKIMKNMEKKMKRMELINKIKTHKMKKITSNQTNKSKRKTLKRKSTR